MCCSERDSIVHQDKNITICIALKPRVNLEISLNIFSPSYTLILKCAKYNHIVTGKSNLQRIQKTKQRPEVQISRQSF